MLFHVSGFCFSELTAEVSIEGKVQAKAGLALSPKSNKTCIMYTETFIILVIAQDGVLSLYKIRCIICLAKLISAMSGCVHSPSK